MASREYTCLYCVIASDPELLKSQWLQSLSGCEGLSEVSKVFPSKAMSFVPTQWPRFPGKHVNHSGSQSQRGVGSACNPST
ncbi:hypothetical protein I79_014279 [Cricetulus griseus]|uniref:Uncharacterized protein n=1 Tax=Cricetulus griseus TaxID=10029 RepID=G3HTQ1_CRIGR|nr:hypothetical protein I79_014279 [Cricetulus griseus]